MQPGVPQLQQIKSSSSAQTASPQSIMVVLRVIGFTTIFQSFMSLWIMLSSDSSCKLRRMFLIRVQIYQSESLNFLATRNSKILTPLASYISRQQVSLLQKTPSNLKIFSKLKSFKMFNYFLKLLFLQKLFYIRRLEKTLTANFLLSCSLIAQQTVAEAPFPNLLIGLWSFQKSSWMTFIESYLIQVQTSFAVLKQKVMVRACQFQSLMPIGQEAALDVGQLRYLQTRDILRLESTGMYANYQASPSSKGQRTMKLYFNLIMYFSCPPSSNVTLAQSAVWHQLKNQVEYYDLEHI